MKQRRHSRWWPKALNRRHLFTYSNKSAIKKNTHTQPAVWRSYLRQFGSEMFQCLSMGRKEKKKKKRIKKVYQSQEEVESLLHWSCLLNAPVALRVFIALPSCWRRGGVSLGAESAAVNVKAGGGRERLQVAVSQAEQGLKHSCGMRSGLESARETIPTKAERCQFVGDAQWHPLLTVDARLSSSCLVSDGRTRHSHGVMHQVDQCWSSW